MGGVELSPVDVPVALWGQGWALLWCLPGLCRCYLHTSAPACDLACWQYVTNHLVFSTRPGAIRGYKDLYLKELPVPARGGRDTLLPEAWRGAPQALPSPSQQESACSFFLSPLPSFSTFYFFPFSPLLPSLPSFWFADGTVLSLWNGIRHSW